jgi:hypothetical protein
MIGPAAWVHGLGGRDTNLRVLGADLRQDIVHVILVVLIVNIGGLKSWLGLFYGHPPLLDAFSYPDVCAIGVLQSDASTIWQCRSQIGPWSLHRRRAGDGNTSAGRKSVVFSIRYTLDHARVMCPAASSARAPVGVCTGKCSEEKRD